MDAQALCLVMSRGCSYDCAFCSCQRMWSRRVTVQTIERTLATIDQIVRRFDYEDKLLSFFDDTFTLRGDSHGNVIFRREAVASACRSRC